MKKFIGLAFIAISALGQAQALRDINYSYLYDPEEKFTFELRPVRLKDQWNLLYRLRLRDTTFHIGETSIVWEVRDGLSQKEGTGLNISINDSVQTDNEIRGQLVFAVSQAPKVVVAKVIHKSQKRAWLFYCALEDNYPVNNFLISQQRPVVKPFAGPSSRFTLGSRQSSWIVSYYNDKFPASAPVFSEGLAKVQKTLKPDSVFTLRGDSAFELADKGLFLFQTDTLAAEGFALRIENDYPKYSRFQNLPGPFIYICSKSEYDRLELSPDKKAFDRTVLSITGDAERAKKLIRSYFRRVELANEYFTSYKEGWKTDRGMIYIIFGLPNEVYKFYDREVWHYENALFEVTFDFAKSGTLFDPENFVLIRDDKYKETWYEVIDLWRNARF